MSGKNQNRESNSNTVKDPDEWTTGDEAMTGAQKSYLKTLSDEAGEEFDENLTKPRRRSALMNCNRKPGAA
jgi:hypothetical protein